MTEISTWSKININTQTQFINYNSSKNVFNLEKLFAVIAFSVSKFYAVTVLGAYYNNRIL